MELNHRSQLSFILLLLIAGGSSRQINLPPYARWYQNGITLLGSADGKSGSSPFQLNHPVDLSITANDVLYVGDRDNHRIIRRHFNATKNVFIISSISYSPGYPFIRPLGLSTTNTSLYVADSNNGRVQQLSLEGTNATTMLDLSGLYKPFYLYVDDHSNIYVSAVNDHQVLHFRPNSRNPRRVIGTGVNGSNNDQLNRPYGVFVTDDRAIFIADASNHRIMKWSQGAPSGIRVGGSGISGSDSTELSYPTQVVVDVNGYMYISDDGNDRIVRWAPSSTFGLCIAACTGVTGIASNQLNRPHSLAFDSKGSLYVTDFLNHRVQRFQILNLNYYIISYQQAQLSTCATWNLSDTNFATINTRDPILVGVFVDTNDTTDEKSLNRTHIVVSNENGTNSRVSPPVSISLYNLFITINGNIYADNGAFKHRFYKRSSDSTFQRDILSQLHDCTSLFIDINDSIYCSYSQDHKVIQILFNEASRKNITFGDGTRGSTPDLLNWPSGLFVDTDLRLYVADTGNDRVQRFEQGNTNGTTVAGNFKLGEKGLKYPTAVVVDQNGYLYILDCGNQRIIRSENNAFRCIVGCWPCYHSLPYLLSLRDALWFDTDGNMFVLNLTSNDRRIQKFSHLISESSSCEIPLTCWHPWRAGINCTYSTELCDVLEPCQNNGTCINSVDNTYYTCNCTSDFNGTHCEHDQRICKADTCWNGGKCTPISTTAFNCTCIPGWEGRRCERSINYCTAIRCLNRGVCQSLLTSPFCECPSGYSGPLCEETELRIIIYQIVSKSFAYVAIIALICVAAFVIIMDILKYCFGIDPVEEERERMPREKRAKKHRPIVQRFNYVSATTDPSTPPRRLSTIAETTV